MLGLTVKGRGVREPVTQVDVTSEGVRIRIDDERNAEFWLEAEFSEELLTSLLARVRASAEEPVGEPD